MRLLRITRPGLETAKTPYEEPPAVAALALDRSSCSSAVSLVRLLAVMPVAAPLIVVRKAAGRVQLSAAT
jgi:hypothetical protein